MTPDVFLKVEFSSVQNCVYTRVVNNRCFHGVYLDVCASTTHMLKQVLMASAKHRTHSLHRLWHIHWYNSQLIQYQDPMSGQRPEGASNYAHTQWYYIHMYMYAKTVYGTGCANSLHNTCSPMGKSQPSCQVSGIQWFAIYALAALHVRTCWMLLQAFGPHELLMILCSLLYLSYTLWDYIPHIPLIVMNFGLEIGVTS